MMKERINLVDMIVIILYVLGFSWGIFIEKNISEDIKIPLQSYFFAEESFQNISLIAVLQSEFLNWLKLYLLGLCFLGIPLLLLYGYLKGVGMGFSIAFTFQNNLWDSAIFSIVVGILPKVLYCIPLIFLLLVATRTSRNLYFMNHSEMLGLFFRYSILMLLGFIVAMICIILQWYLNFWL